jgi:DNA-binding NtrC family response regulator
VERAAILSDGELITPESLFLESRGLKVKRSISDMEKELILEILNSCDNSLQESAKMLGMTQSNLKIKMENYNL